MAERIESGMYRTDDLDYITDKPHMFEGQEMPDEAYYKALDNGMITDLPENGRLVYTHDFYVAMYKKLESGMGSVEAYESLGFDTKVTGAEKAYQAAKRAREKAAANKLYTVDPSSYDGSIPPEQMMEMANLSNEELIAYLKARNYYLEELVEAQKKTQSVLADILTSSKAKR
ncbi:MAG: hypothetical protein IJI87_00440 [Mogibacterium sp.]|nr:hypothetical protein [Mogibacterium sp.]